VEQLAIWSSALPGQIAQLAGHCRHVQTVHHKLLEYGFVRRQAPRTQLNSQQSLSKQYANGGCEIA